MSELFPIRAYPGLAVRLDPGAEYHGWLYRIAEDGTQTPVRKLNSMEIERFERENNAMRTVA